jgi:hypothetical protein
MRAEPPNQFASLVTVQTGGFKLSGSLLDLCLLNRFFSGIAGNVVGDEGDESVYASNSHTIS